MNDQINRLFNQLEQLDSRLVRFQKNMLTVRDFRAAILLSSVVSGIGLTVVSALVLWVAGVFGG
jgi:hypothetical protein